MMESMRLVDGSLALAPTDQQTAEFARDRWDIRNIPGLRYARHRSTYYIIFEDIPVVFRPIAKDYAKFRLASGRAAKTLIDGTRYLKNFLVFFSQRYPETTTFQGLSERDIDAFIMHLKARSNARGGQTSNWQHWLHMHYLENFLCYLERIESPIRPGEPITRLIWPHHYPQLTWTQRGQIKYIPQSVLTQLDHHLPQLRSSSYIPVVILLRASGWRISDVLHLKWDTCLRQEGDHYWLVGDIQKTQVLGHKIPISQEVAAVILAQMSWVKQHYTAEENPHHWLFPASKRKGHHLGRRFRNGDPLEGCAVRRQLNALAATYQIRDEQGALFHFRLHAFRHNKAVELINNGMSLVMVQQWMAHTSPEMTLVYARILDETMHTQWEKAVRQGVVQFTEGKPALVSGKKMLTVISQSQVFDPERVRDHRANMKLPLGNCVKPPKLICKFTELPCFHCPAYILTPEDLPALAAYEQHLLERMEIGKQAGNAYWIEINQRNLEERVRPAMAMLKQEQIVAKSEKYEREYTPDEWTQRQAGRGQEASHE